MNNDLLFDGKSYISAKRAAKLVGYTTDYIGQLSRAKLLDSRMVGRSWYVAENSIREHKKKNLKRPPRILKNQAPQSENLSERNVEENLQSEIKSEFIYIPEARPILPEISKPTFITSGGLIYAHPQKITRAVVLWPVTIFCLAIMLWGISSSPIVSQNISNTVSIATNEMGTGSASVLSAVENFLHTLSTRVRYFASGVFKSHSVAILRGEDTLNGIVVVPDGPNHQATVSRVKRAFSDDVDVSVDPEGDSGVITPVFRTGGDNSDYAFIMVPVRDQKKTTTPATPTQTQTP